MPTPSTPADPDTVAAAREARLFRHTMATIAALTGGLAVLTAAAAHITGRASAWEGAGRGLAFGAAVAVFGLTVVTMIRPAWSARFGLSRADSGDEREQRIASDTTKRVFAATILAIFLYGAFFEPDSPVRFFALAGLLADALITQWRLRRE